MAIMGGRAGQRGASSIPVRQVSGQCLPKMRLMLCSSSTMLALFDGGIALAQLWFQQVGNNLEVKVIGTTDAMTVTDWYLGSAHQVEQFRVDGNKTLLASDVQNLVQAMASFAPPAAGQTTLPQNYQDSLNTVIAANWH